MGGIVVFTLATLISYLLFVVKAPILIIPIILIAIYFGYKPLINRLKKIKILYNLKTAIILVVFSLGIAGQLAVISPSGRFVNGDLVFWSSHGHDAAWHIALMDEFQRGFPFQNPSFANEKLVNYHYFSDILPSIISKYTPGNKINIDLDLYFRVFPFIYSLFFGASAYFLTKKLTNNFSASIWAVIFTYFAGSWGYIIGKGESVFWATQPQSSSGNPPQIVSNFLVLAFIYFAISYVQKKNKWHLLSAILILGTLVEFKVYAAIVLFGATFLSGLWNITIPAGIIAAALYFPNASGSTSFLILQPWWYIRTMIVEPSRLNLLDWELRRQTFLAYHNYKWVIFYEGIGFLIFFFGNLGMRFLGLIEFLRTNKLIKWSIIISLILPLLFLQKGVASNTAQFLQYFVLLMGILAGIATAKLTQRYKFVIPVIILLMIPTQAGLLKDFYSRPAFAKISEQELKALNFVKNNTPENAVLLTPPYNQYLDLGDPTPNIWDWSDTSYVAAFSERRTFMDDSEQADIMGYHYQTRLELKKTIFESTDPVKIKQALSQTNATYIYFPKPMAPKTDFSQVGLTQVFDNQITELWKTN